jgi:RHH-type proline utilization regulon transcriptional repressor/proline dehydrogenase/delta 1-pyrroline-5-carboxylate dehydrogenase
VRPHKAELNWAKTLGAVFICEHWTMTDKIPAPANPVFQNFAPPIREQSVLKAGDYCRLSPP